MTYCEHLKINWRVAFHSLIDFLEHFIHGLVPYIKWQHKHAEPFDSKWVYDMLIEVENMYYYDYETETPNIDFNKGWTYCVELIRNRLNFDYDDIDWKGLEK